jgi:hypothetical protein
MEYTNRGQRPMMNSQPMSSAPQTSPSSSGRGPKNLTVGNIKIVWIAMLFLGTALVAAVVAFLIFSPTSSKSAIESNVKTDQYQAVFLNGGQVYFGKMIDVDRSTVAMKDIYYLRVNQNASAVQPESATQAQPDISLAKLGKELHGPEDVMFINKDQVLFWENLTNDGAVVKAIKEYQANPNASSATPTPTPEATEEPTASPTPRR